MDAPPPVYWCHTCKAHCTPAEGSLNCPTCSDDFLELVELEEQQQPQQQQQQQQQQQIPQNPIQQMLNRLAQAMQQPAAAAAAQNGQGRPMVFTIPMGNGGMFGGIMGGAGGPVDIWQIVNQILGGAGAGGMFGNGNVNFGDFVPDANMDAVLNRLFQAAGPRGPPPADPDFVRDLPMEEIGPADLGEECPVCRDAFVEKESVKVMPCKHRFHQDCLDPWLKMRNTCPVCRYEVKAQQQQQQQQQQPMFQHQQPQPQQPRFVPARPPPPPVVISPVPSPPDSDVSDEEDDEEDERKKKKKQSDQYDNMYL